MKYANTWKNIKGTPKQYNVVRLFSHSILTPQFTKKEEEEIYLNFKKQDIRGEKLTQ